MSGPLLRLVDRAAVDQGMEFAFEGFLPRTGVVILTGDSQVGKSFLALLFATGLATGEAVVQDHSAAEGFGRPERLGATVYVAGEGWEGLKNRIASHELRTRLDPLPIILVTLGERRFSGTEAIAELEPMLAQSVPQMRPEHQRVRAIILDTLLSLFHIRDENSNAEMQSILDALAAYALKFDCLVVGVAHPSKGRGGRRQTLRGASSLYNGADMVLSLSRLRNGVRRLRVSKARDMDTAGRSYDYELVTDGGSAFMRPLAADQSSTASLPAAPAVARINLELLRIFEIAQNGSTTRLENFLGHREVAVTAKQIVDAYVADETKRAFAQGVEPPKADAIRKRVERGLVLLVEATYLDKVSDNGSTYYLATTSQPYMHATVGDLEPPPLPPPPVAQNG